MTVDIRAKVYCSLGLVISGQIADDYVQGSGLIKTRGTIELSGSLRPAAGTVVQLAYQKNGWVARFPRTLRVLSAFCHPFKRTTTVQVGCLLTYMDGRKPPVTNPKAKEENGDLPCSVFDYATIPLSAGYVFQQCLTALSMTSAAIPLTNKFSLDEFDLTPGYVAVMSDLLVSEGYVGHLDEAETLRFIDLSQDVATGPLIGVDGLINLSGINSGDLPGESVLVRYSSKRFKAPDDTDEEGREKRDWELEETWETSKFVSVNWTDPEDGDERSSTASYVPYTMTRTTYDTWDRVISRITTRNTVSGEVDAARLTAIASAPEADAGFRIIDAGISLSFLTTTSFTYAVPATPRAGDGTEAASLCIAEDKPENYSEVLSESTIETGPLSSVVNFTAVAWYIPGEGIASGPSGNGVMSTTDTFYSKDEASGITITKTIKRTAAGLTYAGQQAIARRVESSLSSSARLPIMESIGTYAVGMVPDGSSVRIRTEREFGLQRRPSQAERNNAANLKPVAYEQVTDLEWIVGSPAAQLVQEFSLPYAPDDEITWSEGDGYGHIPSDAQAKALNYGRIQNRLLLGHRNGMSIQTAPEYLPTRPFDPVYINADGITGQFRINGLSWVFDSNGIIASTDALFWGAAGVDS